MITDIAARFVVALHGWIEKFRKSSQRGCEMYVIAMLARARRDWFDPRFFRSLFFALIFFQPVFFSRCQIFPCENSAKFNIWISPPGTLGTHLRCRRISVARRATVLEMSAVHCTPIEFRTSEQSSLGLSEKEFSVGGGREMKWDNLISWCGTSSTVQFDA